MRNVQILNNSLLINGAIEINYSSLQEYGKKTANPKNNLLNSLDKRK